MEVIQSFVVLSRWFKNLSIELSFTFNFFILFVMFKESINGEEAKIKEQNNPLLERDLIL